jgi:NarL family two-component system response regulator LiaR
MPSGGKPWPNDLKPAETLTPRELEVLRLVAEGMTNREIAKALEPSVSRQTVKNHMRALLAKTGMGNRTELALWAQRRDAQRG